MMHIAVGGPLTVHPQCVRGGCGGAALQGRPRSLPVPLLNVVFLPFMKLGKLALRSFVFSAELLLGRPRAGESYLLCVPHSQTWIAFGGLKDRMPGTRKDPATMHVGLLCK